MYIIVSCMNYDNVVHDLMNDIADSLSILQPVVYGYYMKRIYVMSRTPQEIVIDFIKPSQEKVKGTRPDYFWTDSIDVYEYYKLAGIADRELRTFTDLVSKVLESVGYKYG